jgi:GAF domain-containing protein
MMVAMISTSRLADVFVEVADTLVDDFDLMDFLNNLAVHAADVTGTSAVGLMLTDHTGTLRFMAASTADARLLELFQLQHSEGPCVDCHRNGEPVQETDLANAVSRWPTFAPRAVAAGIHSVHAFPLRLRDRTIGALNTFGPDPEPLDADTVRVVQALADVATIAIIAIIQERALARADTLTEQLQFALNSRIVIEQAKGAISRALGVSVDDAFNILRDHARRNRLRLTGLAHDVVTKTETMSALRSR